MKKFKILIPEALMLFLTVCAISAYAIGVWNNPQNIKVYIPPNDDKSQMMKKAFEEWQAKTNNKFAFKFVNKIEASQINVIFIEKDLTNYCGNKLAMGCSQMYFNQGGIHSRIYIAKRRPKGLLLSNTQVYAIMRHEIGHSLGLAHTKQANRIMYDGTNLGIAIRQNIQKEDIEELFNLYGIRY